MVLIVHRFGHIESSIVFPGGLRLEALDDMAAILGIDIGTTSTKAIVFDPDKGVVAEAERDAVLVSRQAGWAEEDAEVWWSNACELIRELVAGRSIAAVGVTGMVPCVVLSDADGRLLRPSIQQNDARALSEITELRAAFDDDRILARTGAPITQQSVAPTLLWLSRHEPAVWSRAALVQGSYDFIVSRLTGAPGVEVNWAVESGLYDLETAAWADDVLAAADISPSLLPPIRQPLDVAGVVTPAAATETGLDAGVPVMSGVADHVAAAFAAGVIDEGELLIKLGGAGDILMATDTPLIDERLFFDLHVIPGKYLPNGCMATSGSLIRWFQRELAQGRPLRELDNEARAVAAGADGVLALPYFLGEKTPLNDPNARGAFVGLHLGHTRAHLYRAVLEAVAYGFRHHIEVFAELGHAPQRIRVSDGGAKSAVWTQIIADVLNAPLEIIAGQGGAAVGAAFVAGMAVGSFSDWREIERFASVSASVAPQPADAYERGYRAYRSLYPALKEVLR
jgi:xylulokinase